MRSNQYYKLTLEPVHNRFAELRCDADRWDCWRRIDDRLGTLIAKTPSGWPIGLEYDLLTTFDFSLRLDSPVFRSPKLQNLHFVEDGAVFPDHPRPFSEFPVIYFFSRPGGKNLTFSDVLQCARLCGGSPELRSKTLTTTRFTTGHAIAFMKPETLRKELDGWIERFNTPIGTSQSAVVQASKLYLEFLIIHPFRDGNGRVARALWQMYILRNYGASQPVIPLGPAFMYNRTKVVMSYLSAEFDNDLSPFMTFIRKACEGHICRLTGGQLSQNVTASS